MEKKYYTGYIPPNTEYPEQPVKIAEITDVAIIQVSGKNAYPLDRVCEILNYSFCKKDSVITIQKDVYIHNIDIKNDTDIIVADNIVYAYGSLFNTRFNISLRYFDSIRLLEIFNNP